MTAVRPRAPESERPQFPSIREDYGEDPARFLTADNRDLPLARIREIDDVGLLNAWLAVERRLYGGRPMIENAIEARRRELGQEGVDE